MPTLNTTITLSETEMAEALTDYLRGKRYEVRGPIVIECKQHEGAAAPTFTATATVEPIPRKKRADGKEDDAAK